VIDVDFAGKRAPAGSGGGVFRVVGDFDELVLAFRVVVDDKLEGMEDGHGAAGAAVQVVALEVFEHFDVDDAIGARDAGGGGEGADGFRGKAAAAQAGEGGHTGIVPGAHALFTYELQQLTFGEQGVG